MLKGKAWFKLLLALGLALTLGTLLIGLPVVVSTQEPGKYGYTQHSRLICP